MKKQVGVITSDFILFNKIRLLLRDLAETTLVKADESAERFDALLFDLRVDNVPEGAITIGDGGRLPIYFDHAELIGIISESEDKKDSISLSASTQSAYLFGNEIKLTDVEYKLLDLILSADSFVSKQEILHTVWGEGYDEGVVNVYIHYLRRKLEKDGKKVIISSRNEGYKIDEKYRRKN